MGISGLLPLLKSIQKPCSLKKFAGQTIGVDAYGWLHRGTVACAIELALGKPTVKYVDFAMSRVRMLIHFGITPYLVFDGDYLPSKAVTEVERSKKRQESRRVGLELHKLGRTAQAHLELQKAVDVTPQMARQFIEELKHIGVQYVVAPYEADAQLAYLERKGIISGILSEDSDLLVFGAKCLITKLDQYGDCVEIHRDDFTACRDISLVGWSDTEFRRMAILSGCDYLPSINGMGLRKAYRLVRKHKTVDRILRMVQFDRQFKVPVGYLEAFQQAELTFLHQWVFCPLVRGLVMNTDPDTSINVDELSFVGRYVEPEAAQAVARGDLDPMTKEPIVVEARHKPNPQTPWTGKKQILQSKSVEFNKCGTSIESFFKPKRTPLAELDPNSFTPSPSQQRLLQQDNQPWPASPAPPRPPSLRSAMSSPAVPSLMRDPSISVSLTSEDRSSGRPISTRPAQKRPRLCSDTLEQLSTAGEIKGEACRSRFFESPILESTLPVNKAGTVKRRRKPDINIWSDDSVEDIMAELADISDNTTIGQKETLIVFKDDDYHSSAQKTSSQQVSADTSQSSTVTVITQASDTAHSQSTTATSVHNPTASQSSTNPFDIHISAELRSLREQYPFKDIQGPLIADHTSKKALASTPHPKPLQNDGPKRAPLSAKPVNRTITHALAGKGSLTPLQRLGVGALSRSRSYNTPVTSKDVPEQVNSPLSIKHNTLASEAAPDNSLRSGNTKTPESNLVNVNRGSEDLLIPDSEDDGSSELSDPGGEECKKPTVDLGRFAFKPS